MPVVAEPSLLGSRSSSDSGDSSAHSSVSVDDAPPKITEEEWVTDIHGTFAVYSDQVWRMIKARLKLRNHRLQRPLPSATPVYNCVVSKSGLDQMYNSDLVYFTLPDPFYPQLIIVRTWSKYELLNWNEPLVKRYKKFGREAKFYLKMVD